jgi:hypothetical protein
LRLGQRTAIPASSHARISLALEVAPIRNGVQVIAAQRGFRRLRLRRQLRSIGADVADLVRNNRMVRDVDRTLNILRDPA